METKPNLIMNGIVLLELSLHDVKNSKLVISVDKGELKSMINFSFAQIDYISHNKKVTLSVDEIILMLERLKLDLIDCLNSKQKLHPSLKKSLGYYYTKDLKKSNRKDLTYETLVNGYRRWVGEKYSLYLATIGATKPSSWLYNDKNGNIILEISPIYPWIFKGPMPGEIFVKYSVWMKAYKPYEIIQISHEAAKKWLQQINTLMQKVKSSDKKNRCTGPGCKICAKEGKSGCPCGSSLI